MSIAVLALSRIFRYNSLSLGDPSPEMDVEAVKSFYAAQQFPELLNSIVEGPVTKNGVATYTFKRAVGDKGRNPAEAMPVQLTSVAEVIQSLASGKSVVKTVFHGVSPTAMKENIQCSSIVHAVVNSSRASRPLPMPQTAFGVWG